MIARLVIWALKARAGLAAVVITANLSGLAVIITELWLSGSLSRLGPNWIRSTALVGIYPTLGFLLGVALAIRDRASHFGWLDQGRKPTEAEARQLLRLPIIITARAFAVWITGVIVATVTLMRVTPDNDPAVMAALFTFGGFESVGLTFLIVDRLIRPTIPVVAAVLGPTMHWSSSVLVRVVVSWAVAAALPLLMLIVVLGNPVADPADRCAPPSTSRWSASPSARWPPPSWHARWQRRCARCVARSIASPRAISVRVPVGSTSEIGRLENSVNELVANLRERQRMRDLFGRHVGTEVAERAGRRRRPDR